MLRITPNGLYCEVGDFYIDPRRRVERAVVTHAHSDHAVRGMGAYLTHKDSVPLLRHRLSRGINVQALEYGERIHIGEATVSLFPAGHILGSAQVRVEVAGEVWVATGDYKREADPLAADFEVVPCHTFITECTFGLPVYQWREPASVWSALNEWWRTNASNGVVSVVRAYSLGKSQRVLLNLDLGIGPVFANQSVHDANAVIRQAGHPLPPTPLLTRELVLASMESSAGHASAIQDVRRSLVIAAGGFDGALAGLPYSVADASGWVLVRKFRQQRHGFPISDHADWPGLLQTVRETGCERVLAMHGFTEPFTRYLREQGLQADPLEAGEGRTESGEQRAENDWLREVCVRHVGSEAEADALISGQDTGSGNQAAGSRSPFSVLSSPDHVLRCVLMHLHRTLGSRGIEMLTVGVWKNDELVPLAHVGKDVDDQLMAEIVAWAEEHTTIEVGPVRTIEPRFVFEVGIGGITPAPRRKVGVRVEVARIVRYVGTDVHLAASIHQVHGLLQS